MSELELDQLVIIVWLFGKTLGCHTPFASIVVYTNDQCPFYLSFFKSLSLFGWNWPSGSGEEAENVRSLQTNRRKDRWTDGQTDT